MARFFIDRPIFAWVIAIMVMLGGVLAIYQLPLSQYPTIAPPQITLSATYTGASAKTMEDSVTQVIEQQMTGLNGLTYMSSSSSSAGSASITLTFAAGTDVNTAQMLVQTKLEQAKAHRGYCAAARHRDPQLVQRLPDHPLAGLGQPPVSRPRTSATSSPAPSTTRSAGSAASAR